MIEVAGSLWSVPADLHMPAVERLRALGLRRLHWDFSDGTMAAAGGFSAEHARAVTEACGVEAEVHVMSDEPTRHVERWVDFCDLVIVHAESRGWSRAVDLIAERGRTPGLAVSLATPATAVPLGLAALCMSIVPGTAGSAFTASSLDTIDALRAADPSRRVGLDGGVQRRHVAAAVDRGAAWLVVGTDLFRTGGDAHWADVLSGPHRLGEGRA